MRGRTLEAPKGTQVRPTYDRVRESLFAILDPVLSGASVLDLFAGSGALAVESLSRGAASATLVESDRSVLAVASENLERLGLSGACNLRRCDALRFLSRDAVGQDFDLVFVDPPYESGLQEPTLELLAAWGALRPGAVVVLERAAGSSIAASYGRLVRSRTQRYGSTEVDIYVLESGARAETARTRGSAKLNAEEAA